MCHHDDVIDLNRFKLTRYVLYGDISNILHE